MTAKRLLADALVEPMASIGWRRRASGWFTWSPEPGFLGVLAVSGSTRHTRPGAALIAPHIGLRHEEAERTVAALCGTKDDYRTPTATNALGHLTPENTYEEWFVGSSVTATRVAEAIAGDVHRFGMPYLRTLVASPSELVAEVRRHPGLGQASGRCRIAVVLAILGDEEGAATQRAAIADEVSVAPDGAYREHLATMLDALDDWLAAREHASR